MLSPNAKKYLNNSEYLDSWGIPPADYLLAIKEATEHIESCPLTELPLYINHPRTRIREIVNKRLAGKI